MKKDTKQQTTQESHILKFDSIKLCKNGSYMVVIGQNLLFLHPNLLAAVKANSKKRAA